MKRYVGKHIISEVIMSKIKNKKKAAKKKVVVTPVEDTNPIWNKELVVTWPEVAAALEFFPAYNIKIDPVILAIKTKMEAGGIFTLDDQRAAARWITSTVAMRIHGELAKDVWDEVAIACADTILEANKHDAK